MTRTKFSRPFVLLAFVECVILFGIFYLSGVAFGGETLSGSMETLGGIMLICAALVLTMFSVGLYSWHVARGYLDLFVRIVAAFALGYAAYAAVAYLVAVLRLPEATLVSSLLLAVPALFLLRLGFLKMSDQAHLKPRVLVLGTGDKAARIAKLADSGPASRFVPTGFVTLEANHPVVEEAQTVPMPADLATYADEQNVDEIVVALEDRRGQLPLESLIDARLKGFEVTDYQIFCERALGRIDVDTLRPSWFFESEGFRSSRVDSLFKRTFDLTLSALLLTFTAPVLLITAIAIRLESPGPIFYRQERVGRGGRPFVLIKFRSMRTDAEKDAPQWAQEADPRVTRVGAIIRKSRVDEIPQVLNVLKGDMSFVGPRPERPYFVDMLAKEIPFYRERHAVRPGITGWAQLNYPYGASLEDAKQKLQYDLFYIKYFSIVFDLSIVVQTVRVVLWPEGAR